MAVKIEIITPEGIAFNGEADTVVLPTDRGQIGILPGHIPLITTTAPGDVVLISGESRESLAVDQGFAKIRGDTISLITEAAIEVSNIDLQRVAEAQKKAEEQLKAAEEAGSDPEVIEELKGSIRFAVAQRLAKGKF